MPTNLSFEEWVMQGLKKDLPPDEFSKLALQAKEEPEVVIEIFVDNLETLSNRYILATSKPHSVYSVAGVAKKLTENLSACAV